MTPISGDELGGASDVQYREATELDSRAIAALHADSWRRHYRGAYADSYLDGDIVPERLEAWTIRLAPPRLNQATVCADVDGNVVGFAHTMFGHDPRWGALLDNLHVRSDLKGLGMAHGCSRRQPRSSSDTGQRSLFTCGCSIRTPLRRVSIALVGAPGWRAHCVVHSLGVGEQLDTGTSGQTLTGSSWGSY